MLQYRVLEQAKPDQALVVSLLAGVKLPTGESALLREEFDEAQGPWPPSAVHGHDLALGSGSVDGIFGALLRYRRGRFLATADAQFAWRGVGSFGYRYADDLTFGASAGGYLVYGPASTLALRLACTGETKGEDTLRGTPQEDTSVTELYVGPEIYGMWTSGLSGGFAVDLPVLRHNSGLQVVPTWRARISVSWRF